MSACRRRRRCSAPRRPCRRSSRRRRSRRRALRLSPFSRAATAMPSAAEIEVDEWAVPKVSYSLSSRRGKPEMPPSWRSVRHALAPAGQDLVRIGLVADVPDEPVVRRVEDVVQRDRQLDRAEVRRQVAAGLRDALQHEGAQLARRAACSSARDRRRRSAGLWMDSRSVYGTVGLSSRRSTTRSARTLQALQRRRRPLRRQRRLGLVAQLVGTAARGVQAEHADVGRLVVVEVLAGGLAERRRSLGDVEDVVDHLEGEADRRRRSRAAPPVRPASARRRRRPSGRWPAAARRSCGGACRAASRSSSGRPTLARSIAWPPAMPARAGGARQQARTGAPAAPARRAVGSAASAPRRPAPASRRRPASPAASPNCTCTVGLPRRSTSLSMHGMSSWTSE